MKKLIYILIGVSALLGATIYIIYKTNNDITEEADIIKEEQIKWENIDIPSHVEMYINKGFDKKEAMKMVAKDRGISKREVYKFMVE